MKNSIGARLSASRRIFLVIPASAALIAALAAYKITRQYEPADESSAVNVRPAPLFQLYDQHSQIVRLQSELGRKKILIVFYDAREGSHESPLIAQLRDRSTEIRDCRAAVLAISAARPSQNRYGVHLERLKTAPESNSPTAEREITYPFPLLSDILYEVHKKYGAFDAAAGQPIEAVFVVDGAGFIQYEHKSPQALGTVDDWIAELREVK
ncbi:MAG TPA: redoxin domain-containing protein [Planctomycetaceae bacterium]|nr:redoxin domain-containing protein [Planctomycetaceae bacterium]